MQLKNDKKYYIIEIFNQFPGFIVIFKYIKQTN